MTSIEQVVERVQLWRGLDVGVSPLAGGLTNDDYLVEAGGAKYVVRIPGRGAKLLELDRANEHANAVAAAKTGVGPRVHEYVPELEVMVLEFIPGTTMSGEGLRSVEMARRMAASIRQLHAGPRFLRDVDMLRVTETYLRLCDEHKTRIPDGSRERMDTIAEVERAMRARPLRTVPCHNDLVAENYTCAS